MRPSGRRAILALALAAIVLSACGSDRAGSPAATVGAPERVKPAVFPLMIRTEATLVVPVPELSRQAQTLAGEPSGAEQILRYAQQYLVPGDRAWRLDTVLPSGGTGFAIAEDGVLATNAHVIDMTAMRDARRKLEAVLPEAVPALRAPFAAALGGVPQQLASQLDEAIAGYVLAHHRVEPGERTVWVILGRASGVRSPATPVPELFLDTVQRGVGMQVDFPFVPKVAAADVIAIGDPLDPGHDLAILRIAERGLPALRLGAGDAQPGEDVLAVGYPGIATLSPYVDVDSWLIPTFTSGSVGIRQATRSGKPLIGFDAAIANGNSGGPVVDESGAVVGVTSLSMIDLRSGNTELSYFIPAPSVRAMAEQAGATPSTGATTRAYARALDAAARGDHASALEGYRELQRLIPWDRFLGDHIEASQAALARDGGAAVPAWAWALAGVALAAAGSAVLVARRRRRARSATARMAPEVERALVGVVSRNGSGGGA